MKNIVALTIVLPILIGFIGCADPTAVGNPVNQTYIANFRSLDGFTGDVGTFTVGGTGEILAPPHHSWATVHFPGVGAYDRSQKDVVISWEGYFPVDGYSDRWREKNKHMVALEDENGYGYEFQFKPPQSNENGDIIITALDPILGDTVSKRDIFRTTERTPIGSWIAFRARIASSGNITFQADWDNDGSFDRTHAITSNDHISFDRLVYTHRGASTDAWVEFRMGGVRIDVE